MTETLAGDAPSVGAGSAELETRDGVRLQVRPAAPDDEALLAGFFEQVAPADLQFRFLSPMRQVPHEMVKDLVAVDHGRTENLLAFADGQLVATAMIAADATMERAEVAIATRADFKHRGVGWTLLQHVADFAKAKGLKTLESIESRENREAIELEKEMGFTVSALEGDPTLLLVRKQLG
jgi:GNAT superfamily N-acetyltransferase